MSQNHFHIDMSIIEQIKEAQPLAKELILGRRIPPILIKLSVRIKGYFRNCIRQ